MKDIPAWATLQPRPNCESLAYNEATGENAETWHELSSALFVVPPGRHTVRAEIRKREYDSISSFQSSNAMSGNASQPLVWGKECQRRVMWMVQACANPTTK